MVWSDDVRLLTCAMTKMNASATLKMSVMYAGSSPFGNKKATSPVTATAVKIFNRFDE
jgi:hypothetical protein